MKHVTIKDLAKELNVSVSTISRAFNDKYDIKKDTKEKILAKAKELGYHPNPIAKKLIQKRSFNIGVIIPEFINSFFPRVIIGIQDVLHKAGYQVLIMQANESEQTELENLHTLENNMVDGMIISLCKDSANIEDFKRLANRGYPMVLFNRVNDKIPAPQVIFDDYKWAFFATEHLIEQGYKKIYHLYSNPNISLTGTRIKGYKDALKKHKLPFNDNMLFDGQFTIDGGMQAARLIIESKNLPDAIFAANDPMAIGAMKVFKNHGLKIPQDIGLIGFSESSTGKVVDPPLSTVSQPTFKMGQECAKLLINQIEREDELEHIEDTFEHEVITMSGRLIIRESSLSQKK